MSKTKYNSRVFLNDETSHYTGASICYYGEDVIFHNKLMQKYAFFELKDCKDTVRLHMDTNLPLQEYVDKIAKIRQELQKYEIFLQQLRSMEENERLTTK